MNELLNKNFYCLKKINPKILNYYIKEKVTIKNYSIYTNLSGIYIPVDIKNKCFLYNKEDPYINIEEALEESDLFAPVIIVFGFGFGYHIEKILNRYKNSLVFIVENNIELFYLALNSVDITKIISNPNINLLFNVSICEFFVGFEKILGNIYITPDVKALTFENRNEYKEILDTVLGNKKLKNQTVSQPDWSIKNFATLKMFQDKWDVNIVRNINVYIGSPGIKNYYNIFLKKTAIIIGAGPSLSDFVEKLKKIKNYFFIIAADSAMPVLKKYNIEPDIIVSIDTSEINLKFLSESHYNSFLLSDVALDNKIISKFKDKTILVHYGHSMSSWLDIFKLSNDKTVAVGSVSCVGFDLAFKLGCDKIIFCGLDFCYRNCELHSLETDINGIHNKLNKFLSPATLIYSNFLKSTEDTFYKENVLTTKTFLNWKYWFETQIEALKKYNVKFYNLRSTGMQIKGTQAVKIKDIEKLKVEKIEFFKILKQTYENSRNSQLKIFQKETKNFIDILNKIKYDIDNNIKNINKINKYIQRIEKRSESKNIKFFIDKIQECLNKVYRDSLSSDIIRWSILLDEFKYRNICFHNETDVINKIDLLKPVLINLSDKYSLLNNLIEKIEIFIKNNNS